MKSGGAVCTQPAAIPLPFTLLYLLRRKIMPLLLLLVASASDTRWVLIPHNSKGQLNSRQKELMRVALLVSGLL